ncbi:uncharacterized protein LY89DRAFT_666749 [Mollisia scopiformis]|uniref:Uncharacterized protein n=1 Tax=Mollisia scopiformis TaxID=149040 RepID=A0A194XJH4_MOLSC|nr:uncharacterized protein LY89DRAFT_666749 [Mollisia scopiformis]KUJ19907.1 hypothetical protein LY89DRAFT_666749 [Mollisia scopiformis]
MPPKTKAPATGVEKYNLQLPMHLQLLYSIILEVGLPTGTEAWDRIASRIPVGEDGKDVPGTAIKKRWHRLETNLDKGELFGEDHKDILAESKTKVVKEVKKVAVKEKKVAKGKGKGKEKAQKVVEEIEDEEQDGDEVPEASSSKVAVEDEEMKEPPAKKAKVEKSKKEPKKLKVVKSQELKKVVENEVEEQQIEETEMDEIEIEEDVHPEVMEMEAEAGHEV